MKTEIEKNWDIFCDDMYEYDKLALREPMSGQQVLNRMIWERLRNILIKRYGRYE